MPRTKVIARLNEIQVELRGGIQERGIQERKIHDDDQGNLSDGTAPESLKVTVQTFDVLLDDIKGFVEKGVAQGQGEQNQQSVEAVAIDQASGKALSSRQNSSESNSSESNHELKDRIAEFESSHPRITSFLTEVTELLASIGI